MKWILLFLITTNLYAQRSIDPIRVDPRKITPIKIGEILRNHKVGRIGSGGTGGGNRVVEIMNNNLMMDSVESQEQFLTTQNNEIIYLKDIKSLILFPNTELLDAILTKEDDLIPFESLILKK